MEITLKELAKQLYDDATVALCDDLNDARETDDADIAVDNILEYYEKDKRVVDFFSLIDMSEELYDDSLTELFDEYTDEQGMSLRDYLFDSTESGFSA